MSENGFRKLAVIGAGNMGSGIAQKMATEGFQVVLVDLDDEKVARGLGIIEKTLAEGVERKVFRPEQAEAIRGQIEGTADWSQLADVDLVVEAVFEDLEVKKKVFERLEQVCPETTIFGTNTSSFSVTDLAAGARHPGRIVGLHYFYHPAKNRLVEVVPGAETTMDVTERAWGLQEQLGKTPIASADASGFVVNRFFVPWLNEAVRLLEEGVADIPTIEAASKQVFGVGMGPFELMNVTGIPIAQHAATTLGQAFGPLYAPTDRLEQQVSSGELWPLDGEADTSKFDAVRDRMLAVTFYVAAALVDEGVGSVEDTDIGARVGLRWPRGPFQMINRAGVETAMALVQELCGRWNLSVPSVLTRQQEAGKPFSFRFVTSRLADGIATLTINRPDAMNALNETVVAQLHDAFRKVAIRDDVRGIVLAGAGKAFVAGADIRFFVKNIDAGDIDRIVSFTQAGQDLLREIDDCDKPVIARLHGLALGGGLELALACDRIVATPRATVAFPETGIGIYPGLGGTQRTPRKIGPGLAKWLIYTGRTLSAKEGAAIGLIDAVAPHAELDATIRKMIDEGLGSTERSRDASYDEVAEFFASHPVNDLLEGKASPGEHPVLAKSVKQVGFKAPVALRLSERLIEEGSTRELIEGLQMELDHLTEIFATADAYEGLSSLGKKRPVFQGK